VQHEESGAMMTLALPFPAVEGKGAVAAVGVAGFPSTLLPALWHSRPAGAASGAAACSALERGQMQESLQKCINLPEQALRGSPLCWRGLHVIYFHSWTSPFMLADQ